MLKVTTAIAAALVLVLAGCASQTAGAGSSYGVQHDETWNSPIPEQPGNNRWHTPPPPA